MSLTAQSTIISAPANLKFDCRPLDRNVALQHILSLGYVSGSMLDEKPLKIAVVDVNELRASVVLEGLRDAGHHDLTWIQDVSGLMRQLSEIDPDVVVIDLENPSRDNMEQMFEVSRAVRRPVAMFIDQSDRMTMEAALEAGVSAYVVNGMKKERMSAILDMAVMRFNVVARLKTELERTKVALGDRKIIERAKGIVMKQKALDETAAYALSRSTAMNRHVRMSEIAQTIVTAAEILD
jgi:two-component system, response regulator / RNA-binding antiterminator